MLVISRRAGEQLAIGDAITVEVVEIRHDRVRLGVVAPAEYLIQRLPEHGPLKVLTVCLPPVTIPADKDAAPPGLIRER
jgi:hypothetical protein